MFHNPTNLSLGGTTRNVMPQIYVTHPTSRQHMTHIKKLFIPNYLSKGYPSNVELKTLIKFIKKCVLMWKMNA
jgi:hypothetical protein